MEDADPEPEEDEVGVSEEDKLLLCKVVEEPMGPEAIAALAVVSLAVKVEVPSESSVESSEELSEVA